MRLETAESPVKRAFRGACPSPPCLQHPCTSKGDICVLCNDIFHVQHLASFGLFIDVLMDRCSLEAGGRILICMLRH